MSDKVKQAQNQLPPLFGAKMAREFQHEFRGIYPDSVLGSSLCAAGPLEAMFGLAVKRGWITVHEDAP
ncbi:MAG: hypothetical protein AAGC86_06980 [Pseudomonadota bacterium]